MKAFAEYNNYEIVGEYEDAGKLMISVLSAVAEIERENIRVQIMEGRIQKAREGKRNGGFAPYGYSLEKGQLFINEEEAEAIRVIFDQYVHRYGSKWTGKDNKIHLLSGIVKCPVCGAGMYGNMSIKHKSDGTKYKDFFYYGCKHRTMLYGHKCYFKKQINEELLDDAVAEVIVKLVSNPKFAVMMQEKINMKVDTSVIEQEIAAHEKQLQM